MNHRGLGARLFATQMIVLLIGALTLWWVAAVIGPRQFHKHLHEAIGGEAPSSTLLHVEEAFRSASVYSLATGILASVATAVAVTTFATRRVSARLSALANAAADVADGRYEVRLAQSGLGTEFEELTGSLNQMAERLDQTETVRRRLLSDLAHELRTPMATLEAWLEALADGVVTADDTSIAVPLAQMARLRRLVEDVAAVSRAEERALDLRLAPQDPAEVVRSVAESHRAQAQAGRVQLVARATPGLPSVLVDTDRMSEIMGNLVDNALKHTSAGGTVTLGAAAAGDEVTLEVRDTGQGIPPDALPHLFERFYRVDAARDRAHGGSGIGLAISQALARAHDGRITAQSPGLGAGAVFTVHLPAARAAGPRRRLHQSFTD